MLSLKYTVQNILSFAALLLSFSAISQPATNLASEILKLVRYETNIDLKDFPRLSVAVISENGIEYISYSRGVPLTDPAQAAEHEIFEIGELSQIYTSFLFYHLQKEQKLSTSDAITAYIQPESAFLSETTLDNLLMNTTGLPHKRPKDIFQPGYPSEEQAETLDDLIHHYSRPLNGSKHSYNNVDYALLGDILGRISGTDYSAAVNRCLPENFRLPEITGDFEPVMGHNRIGQVVPPKIKDIYYPADGIKCSLMTLTKFIEFLLKDTINEKYLNFVTDESIGNSRFPQLTRHRGWNSAEVSKNTKILLQQGKTEGFTSFTALYPEGKTAVVLLANTSANTEGLGYFILRMVSNYWKKRNKND